MSRLLLLPPAPVIEQPGGQVLLDAKFVEGMRLHAAHWPGPVTCVMRRGAQSIPFGAAAHDTAALGFDLHLLDPGAEPPEALLREAALVMASGDSAADLALWRLRRAGAIARLVYAVEMTLGTRLRSAWLDPARGALRRLGALRWNLAQEPLRRRAFRAADGLQCNGYPAFEAFGRLCSDTLLYLDNRMDEALFATAEEMAARAAHLRGGGPLRIIHSGRLEPLKGAQDLVPVARALVARGVDFTLDIYGTGSLEGAIARAAAAPGLQGRVRLHAPVEFASELVPATRRQADLFLSCHRQADPSCTYLEAMGCGVPVLGYANAMWAALQRHSGAGWAVPGGRPAALAEAIAAHAAAPEAVIAAGQRALAFARGHGFEAEFARRMAHLRRLAGL